MWRSAEDPINQLPHQDWDTFNRTSFELVNITCQRVPDWTHDDNGFHQFQSLFGKTPNLEVMRPSLLLNDPRGVGQDSSTFPSVESQSNMYVGTGGGLPFSAQEYVQDVPIADNTITIQGGAEWTHVHQSSDKLGGMLHTAPEDNGFHQFQSLLGKTSNLEVMRPSLLLNDPRGVGQDSSTFPSVESQSNMYVGTGGGLPFSAQEYVQDVPIADNTITIQGGAEWTHVHQSSDKLEGVLDTAQCRNSLTTTNSGGIPLTRAEMPQRADLERKSNKISRRFSPIVTSILSKGFAENPYPGRKELLRLSGKTHLTYDQVVNWFIAERGRESKLQNRDLTRVGVTLKKKHTLAEESIKVLKAWTDNNLTNRRPSVTEKRALAQQANLKLQQVSDWFGGYYKKQGKLQFSLQLVEEDHGSYFNMRGELGMPELDVKEPGNNVEIHYQDTGFVNQPSNQPHEDQGLMEMKDGRVDISDLVVKDSGNNVEIHYQDTGFVNQPSNQPHEAQGLMEMKDGRVDISDLVVKDSGNNVEIHYQDTGFVNQPSTQPHEDQGLMEMTDGRVDISDLIVKDSGNNVEIHYQDTEFVNQPSNQPHEDQGLMEMADGRVDISDLVVKDSGNNAEIHDQNTGFVYQLEKDLVSGHEFWDEEELLSYLHGLPL